MKYTVYKTTNKVNNKFYIGKHQTENLDDDYLGSGKHLNHAIKKYGLENFTKEILFVFDNEEEMNAKEAELVTEEFCKDVNTYNICPGGKGGWGYVNQNNLIDHQLIGSIGGKNNLNSPKTKDHKEKISNSMIKFRKINKEKIKPFLDKNHSKEAKTRIGKANSKHQAGSGNSQFGSMWITNGLENKKIKKTDVIPEGWNKGRKILSIALVV